MFPRPRFCLALACALAGPLRAADDARLNILFVFADDWGRYASCYRGLDGRPTPNDVINTPNVDRMAREGTLFRNAFVNSPSCTPCRSSLMSGRYFFQTGRGAILNGAVWDETIPAYPLMLREAGYHIGKSYKVWSPGTPTDAPFGGQQFAYEKAGALCNKFSSQVTRLLQAGATLDAARTKVLGQVRQNFDDFLAARPPGQPWHYFFGPRNTHRAWEQGSGKKLWGIDPDSLKGKLPKFLPDEPEVREDVADYLGECQAVDAFVGVLVQRLEEVGELERTVIVISGDHGMPGVPSGKTNLYDHGTAVPLVIRWPGRKGGRIVDDIVRLPDLMPTFLEIARVPVPANLYGRSLTPLFASEQSGVVDPTRNWAIYGRERHVGMARPGNLPYPTRGLRTPEFNYVRNFRPDRWPLGEPYLADDPHPDLARIGANTNAAFPDMDASPTKTWLVARWRDSKWQWYENLAFGKRPAEELYDVRKDPDQVVNLADDPAYAAIKRELSEKLLRHLREAGDPRVTGDGLTYERPPFTDPEPTEVVTTPGGETRSR